MRNVLQNIRDALNDGVFLLLEEMVTELPVYLWGMDKFIWNTPEDEQEYGLWMSYEHWIDLFKETGFEVVVAFKSLNSLFLVRKSRAVSSGSSCVVPEQVKRIQEIDPIYAFHSFFWTASLTILDM